MPIASRQESDRTESLLAHSWGGVAVLRELMRHESIETAMRFYVGQDAEATADE